MNFEELWREIASDVEAMRPPQPPEGTIEYARWLDNSNTQEFPDLEKVFEKHKPRLFNPQGPFSAEYEPTPELITDLLVECRNVPGLADRFERNVPLSNKRVVWPKDYRGDLRDYVRGSPFIRLFKREYPLAIPQEPRFAGTYVIGPSGSGKTKLLQTLVLNDLADQSQPAIIMMDSKAEGQTLLSPFTTSKHIQDRLLLILPKPNLAINPLNIPGSSTEASIELMTYIMSGLVEGMTLTALQQTLFRYVLRALIESYNKPTIKDLQSILESGVPAEVPLRPQLRSFFDNEYMPSKGKSQYSETRQQLQWRLRLLLDNPIMEGMLSCKETRIDLAYEINQGKIIVIDANTETLSDIGSQFFQRFWIALILNAASLRGRAQGWSERPCFVYCDEFHNWGHGDPNLVKILDRARAAKIGITLAHQRVQQLSPEVFDAVANCPVKFANVDNDAGQLAAKFRTTAEAMRHDRPGIFTCFVRGHGTYTVHVPNFDFSQFGCIDEEDVYRLALRHRQYYVTEEKAEDHAKIDDDPLGLVEEHAQTTAVQDPDNIPTTPSKDW